MGGGGGWRQRIAYFPLLVLGHRGFTVALAEEYIESAMSRDTCQVDKQHQTNVTNKVPNILSQERGFGVLSPFGIVSHYVSTIFLHRPSKDHRPTIHGFTTI